MDGMDGYRKIIIKRFKQHTSTQGHMYHMNDILLVLEEAFSNSSEFIGFDV